MKKLLIPLLLLTSIAACKKETKTGSQQLGPPTHTGANTVGCLIDGRAYVVSGKSYLSQPRGVLLSRGVNGWNAVAQTKDEQIYLSFKIDTSPVPPVTFYFDSSYEGEATYSNYSNGTIPGGVGTFNSIIANTSRITLTDYTEKYGSGTFSFDALNSDSTIIHITNGQFDIEF